MQTDLPVYASGLPLERLKHLPDGDIRILADIKRAVLKAAGNRPHRILLFGSKARGHFGKRSDLDVAIIVDGMTRELKKAIYDAVIDVEFEYSTFTSTLPLSTEEFEHLVSRERRIALDIQRDGIPL